MARQNSFDVVCKTDLNEVGNAIQQVRKEIGQRFDFKGSVSRVELEDTQLNLLSDDEFKLRAMTAVLEQKLIKRGVSLKALSVGRIEPAAGGNVRQRIEIQQGIPTDKAKEIVKFIKRTKLKVQASIQSDLVRVSGRDRDTLQSVIRALRDEEFGIEMQFTNYRSK